MWPPLLAPHLREPPKVREKRVWHAYPVVYVCGVFINKHQGGVVTWLVAAKERATPQKRRRLKEEKDPSYPVGRGGSISSLQEKGANKERTSLSKKKRCQREVTRH